MAHPIKIREFRATINQSFTLILKPMLQQGLPAPQRICSLVDQIRNNNLTWSRLIQFGLELSSILGGHFPPGNPGKGFTLRMARSAA
jgi:hypothetical protein